MGRCLARKVGGMGGRGPVGRLLPFYGDVHSHKSINSF